MEYQPDNNELNCGPTGTTGVIYGLLGPYGCPEGLPGPIGPVGYPHIDLLEIKKGRVETWIRKWIKKII